PAGVAGVLQRVMDLNAAARPASAVEMSQMFRESEKYAGAIDASSSFAARSSQAVLSQPTKLMPEDTRQGRGKSTDLPTEIHPGFDSEETKIRTSVPRPFASTAPETKRKSRSGLIAALSGILILCVGAFGAYVFRSKLLPTSSPSTVNTDQPASPQNVSTETPSNTTEGSATERSEAGESQTSDKGKTSPERPDTAKTTKPNNREKQPSADNENGDGDLDDSTVYVGNMRIRSGRVETPDTIIDENGIRRKNGNRPPTPNFPTLTREQMQQMTPQQRRRIRQIYLRNQGGNYPTPPDQ
ncbi:MAG: hypothetical protein ABI878_13600, partial [Acidobacteriota bacterium]